MGLFYLSAVARVAAILKQNNHLHLATWRLIN